VDNILEKTKFDEYDAVIITDCHPKFADSLTLSEKIIILDHHPHPYHNPDKNYYSIRGICGALVTKCWVESTFNIKLSNLDTLIQYTNDYDLWIHKHHKSRFINELFWKYGDIQFRNRFMSGNVRFTSSEVAFLRKRRKEFVDTYDKLEIFEFEKINACFVSVSQFVNDLAERLMKIDGYNMAIVQNPRGRRVSVRQNDDDVNIGEVLENLGIGGGHGKSGGLDKAYSNLSELKKEFDRLEEYLYEKYPSWRKV
jgi:nanoRNase/pAp phosphatase (c-di-AMP/oligoRNAs hydrolase)